MLAAFVDGNVTREERSRIVNHLVACGDCREVVAETARFLEEDEATEEGEVSPEAAVVAHPRARWARWTVLAVSAAAAAAVLIVAWPAGPPTAAGLVAELGPGTELAPRLPADWDAAVWPVNRGPLGCDAEKTAPFCAGARAVDLAIALRIGDRERSASLASEVASYLSAIEFTDEFQSRYRSLRDRIDSGEPLESVGEAAAALDRALERELAFYERFYALGRWAEAGRLAAASGELEYFRARKVRRFADRLDLSDLPPKLADRLRSIRETLRDPVAAEDLPALAGLFTDTTNLAGSPSTYSA